MRIQFDSTTNAFTLTTRNTTYQMRVDRLGHLQHLYYGRRVEGDLLDDQILPANYGFSPVPYHCRAEQDFSLDVMPQEYTGCNTGDFRVSCLGVSGADGAAGADFCYVRHEILPGKYQVDGLPCVYDNGGEAETLVIHLADPVTGLQLELSYGVFDGQDVITRQARLVNGGGQTMTLSKAASACLDLPYGQWDLIHFHGRHCMERQMERLPLGRAVHTVSSRRGASSHHHNPFVILCDHTATEDAGDCYGIMLVYSGSHRTDIEVDQTGCTRAVTGIHDELFSWTLAPGEVFDTPEVILSFTHEGLARLSQNYHRIIRHNVCRGAWKLARRPILINNWEATYFHFDADQIVEIAAKAAELGVEMLVLDDGWFGKRDDDHSGLGDWFVNEEKLAGGLDPLIARINALGMQFGLWVEPEMVSEDSDLYRAHPDWALTLPGREPAMGRHQLVLDLSRPEVTDYLYQRLSALLRRHKIDYIKWDMNRNMTDVYSRALPPQRQGEVAHRYLLGLYRLLDRLTGEFPQVLFEGCAGGGGRFDAGMLAYFPQIWCSDDTDAVERLAIQHGTSFGYPVSTVGAHVSACPNHQTGRTTPLGTRAVVAMAGTFGYELDLNKLSAEEIYEVCYQVEDFKRYYHLIQDGLYYRLTDVPQEGWFTAWQIVAPDQSEALVSVVLTHPRANTPLVHLRLKGLSPQGRYRVERLSFFGTLNPPDTAGEAGAARAGRTWSGAALMYAGYTLPQFFGDFPSVQIHFVRV